MACERCPCPDACLATEVFCGWAMAESPEPAKLEHICIRSRMGTEPRTDPPDSRPSAAESLALTRAMRACPYRSVDAACGCSGGRCALRGGAAVSHVDCFDCLRRYPEGTPDV